MTTPPPNDPPNGPMVGKLILDWQEGAPPAPADAALLRDEASVHDKWAEAYPSQADYHNTRAARLRALADVLGRESNELRVWRWLHWSEPNAAWACRCGGANGHGIDECPECGTLRPAKGRPLT